MGELVSRGKTAKGLSGQLRLVAEEAEDRDLVDACFLRQQAGRGCLDAPLCYQAEERSQYAVAGGCIRSWSGHATRRRRREAIPNPSVAAEVPTSTSRSRPRSSVES